MSQEQPAGGRRLRSPRTAAFFAALALFVYLVLMGDRAFIMITSGKWAFIGLGVAIFVLPVLGAVLVVDQLRFGMRTERLTRRMADEGELPDIAHLPRRPSGRVHRAAADEWFDQKQAELEQDEENWRRWYALAQAYDLAGDRNRGRRAMRRAIDLERQSTAASG